MGPFRKAAGAAVRALAIAGPALVLLAVLARFAGVRYMCVLSSSMERRFPAGSLIVVVPAAPEKLTPGRDVTYRLGTEYVTHRIVGTDAEARVIVTKGLENASEDPPVSFDSVVGVPVLCVPGLGRASVKLSGIAGKIAVVSAGLLAVTAVLTADLALNGSGRGAKRADPAVSAAWNAGGQEGGGTV